MKMINREILAGAAAIAMSAIATLPASAQTGRYVMEKTEDGFIRMDTETGDMSFCAEKSGQIVCRLAADERTAFQDVIDRLDERITELEARMDRTFAVPTEEEFDQGLDNMERFFRRFLGIVEEYDKKNAKPAEPEAPANKT